MYVIPLLSQERLRVGELAREWGQGWSEHPNTVNVNVPSFRPLLTSPNSGEELPNSVPPRFSVPRKLRPFRPPLTPPDSGGELRRLAPLFGLFGASKRDEWSLHPIGLEPPSESIQIHIYTLVFSKFLTRTVCARYARTP